MKSRRLALALSLVVLTGAALWGVSYRLDHPPLSKADKEFRALVAGADSVEVSDFLSIKRPFGYTWVKIKTLDSSETHELIEKLRFSQVSPTISDLQNSTLLELRFKRQGQLTGLYTLHQTQHSSQLSDRQMGDNDARTYQLHPRFEKPLRHYLDQVLPQRIRS